MGQAKVLVSSFLLLAFLQESHVLSLQLLLEKFILGHLLEFDEVVQISKQSVLLLHLDLIFALKFFQNVLFDFGPVRLEILYWVGWLRLRWHWYLRNHLLRLLLNWILSLSLLALILLFHLSEELIEVDWRVGQLAFTRLFEELGQVDLVDVGRLPVYGEGMLVLGLELWFLVGGSFERVRLDIIELEEKIEAL